MTISVEHNYPHCPACNTELPRTFIGAGRITVGRLEATCKGCGKTCVIENWTYPDPPDRITVIDS